MCLSIVKFFSHFCLLKQIWSSFFQNENKFIIYSDYKIKIYEKSMEKKVIPQTHPKDGHSILRNILPYI